MKKILLVSGLFTLMISSCVKKDATTSTVASVSYPTITLTNGEYFSVNVNAPYPTVTASAVDSFYNPCTTQVLDTAIHTSTAGLYTGLVLAQNAKGFQDYVNYYVAVTNVSPLMNLAGTWSPVAGPLLTTAGNTVITKLANGLYLSDNTGEADRDTAAYAMVPDIFAVTDLVTFYFPANDANYSSPGTLSMIPGDTTISYTTATGGTITFVKVH
jgi:hypothetical protein